MHPALARTVDLALEATVAPSFSRIGPAVRRRVDDWGPLPRLDGQRVLVTGVTSGIGRAAAARLLALGAHVVAVGRDETRTHRAMAELTVAAGNPAATVVIADLGELDDVRRVADEAVTAGPLHALVHNAGALLPEHRRTSDGIEVTVAVQRRFVGSIARYGQCVTFPSDHASDGRQVIGPSGIRNRLSAAQTGRPVNPTVGAHTWARTAGGSPMTTFEHSAWVWTDHVHPPLGRSTPRQCHLCASSHAVSCKRWGRIVQELALLGVTPSQTRRSPLGAQLLDAGRAGASMKRIDMNDPEHVQATGGRWMVSVFGDITRRGSWPSRDRLSPVAVFGDIDLDFRQAGMPAGQVVIHAVAPFGSIDVLVPDGVQVDVGGFTLFGSKKIAVGDAATNESAAVIRVRGFSLLGSVKVSS